MTASEPKAVQDSQGNLLVTLDKPYNFREPKGRDLETIERSLGDNPSNTRLAAVILGTLSLDNMTSEDFLDLPASIFKEVSKLVTESFRLFSN